MAAIFLGLNVLNRASSTSNESQEGNNEGKSP